MKRVVVLAAVALLGGCGSTASDPSGASPSEARQLNDAAAMLDENSVSADAVGANQAGEAQ
ncbi:MAG: hypothetical protein K2P79_13370 [Sphingomonas sp.]|jgi:hypothetical protein|nr:hypothetical protein [Sphingomonas sp.]